MTSWHAKSDQIELNMNIPPNHLTG